MEVFELLPVWAQWPTYAIAAFAGWYALNALEYGLNGGQLGRGRWWAFECFWEEFLESIPGGMERKVDKLKEMVGPHYSEISGVFVGPNRSWTHEELRDGSKEEWEACAKVMLGSFWKFWLLNVFLYFFILGPIATAVIAIWIVLAGIWLILIMFVSLLEKTIIN